MKTVNFLVVIIFFGILVFYAYKSTQAVEIPENYPLSPFVDTIVIKPQNNKKEDSLKKLIDDKVADFDGNYAVVVKNLKIGQGYSLNGDKPFEPASLYKLWVMATVYHQIEEGLIDKDEVLSDSVANLNSIFQIDPEFAELSDEIVVTLSVSKAVNQMITISHNYAAMLLTKKIGVSKMNEFLVDNGILNSETRPVSKTTANDIALFYEKLYMGELSNKGDTKEMIDILKGQALNDRIPKYLPENIEIAHKTGELGDFKHDAGIVYTPKGDYIIVVLSESNRPDLAAENIAELSKSVYNYFSEN